jgi:hypothetical protein
VDTARLDKLPTIKIKPINRTLTVDDFPLATAPEKRAVKGKAAVAIFTKLFSPIAMAHQNMCVRQPAPSPIRPRNHKQRVQVGDSLPGARYVGYVTMVHVTSDASGSNAERQTVT